MIKKIELIGFDLQISNYLRDNKTKLSEFLTRKAVTKPNKQNKDQNVIKTRLIESETSHETNKAEENK